MPRFLRCLLLPLILNFSLPVFANQVIVKGTVKYSDGTPIAKKAVYIMPDSLAVAGCNVVHTVYTNPNGYYIDTLSCSSAITKVRVRVEDCNGTSLLKDPQVPASGVVEINFSVSCNPPVHCEASFTFAPDSLERSFHFNSSTSTGDDITSRKWYFGDGDSLAGNIKDPHHIYASAGNYTACLLIRTTSGCEAKVCKVVEVTGHCKAVFQFTLPTSTGLPANVKFNSGKSVGSSNRDSITERIWSWGDGTANLAGNAVEASHAFSQPGSYTACLRITTAQRCHDTFCVAISIPKPVPAVTCFARFTNQNGASANTVKFSADSVVILPGDSLSYYRWEFGDGTQQSGSSAQAEHHYAAPGIYKACLVMVTRRGCEYRFCKEINLAAVVVKECKAVFTWEKLGPKKIRVNSSTSSKSAGDSIVQRRWEFGDGFTFTGNSVNPDHTYNQNGTYNVCLYIKTAKGCESSFCTAIRIGDSTNSTTDSTKEAVTITQLYPNPASSVLHAVVYSRYGNVQATLSIYDIYGELKWSISKNLVQGNNFSEVVLQQLPSGPYVFRVTTSYGKLNKNFYKL